MKQFIITLCALFALASCNIYSSELMPVKTTESDMIGRRFSYRESTQTCYVAFYDIPTQSGQGLSLGYYIIPDNGENYYNAYAGWYVDKDGVLAAESGYIVEDLYYVTDRFPALLEVKLKGIDELQPFYEDSKYDMSEDIFYPFRMSVADWETVYGW